MWTPAFAELPVIACMSLGAMSLALLVWGLVIARNEKIAQRNLIETGKAFLREAQTHGRNEGGKGKPPGKLKTLLVRAGIDMGPLAWYGCFFGGALAGAAFLSLLGFPPIIGAVTFAVALALSIGLPKSKAGMNDRLFAEQLAQALPQIAENARCGLSPESAVRSVSSHMGDPLRGEFRRLNSDVAYGSTLAEAFEAMALRTGSGDIKLVATVVAVQAARGGKLSDTFDMVAETISARLDLRRHVRVITTESRTSMWVVAVLPWIFLILMGLTDRSVFLFYQTSAAGWMALAAAIVLEVAGVLVMARLSKIKVS